MSSESTWSVVNMNSCGCDMFIYAPYLQSKFHTNSVDSTLISGDYLPPWAEIKVKIKPSFISLILYLSIGQVFGGIILFLLVGSLFAAFHVFLSIIIIYAWLYTTVGEVIVLLSRTLGVQCSCQYLSGRWRRSPLIPIHRIRTVHLLDRVTNVSVNPHIFLELRRSSTQSLKIDEKSAPTSHTSPMLFESKIPAGSASCFIKSASAITDDTVNELLKLQPLFSVPADDNDIVSPLCCLPLQSLVTIYRLSQVVLFRETVPCAF